VIHEYNGAFYASWCRQLPLYHARKNKSRLIWFDHWVRLFLERIWLTHLFACCGTSVWAVTDWGCLGLEVTVFLFCLPELSDAWHAYHHCLNLILADFSTASRYFSLQAKNIACLKQIIKGL
jgi:hypothetical protein